MPTCSASSVEKRPIRSMCAPVSSSLNSTAIDRRLTVSACAISSSESARCSSLERLSISCSSAPRRCSPIRHPSVVAAHASTTTQPATRTRLPAATAPTAASTPNAPNITHPRGEPGPGESSRGGPLRTDACFRGSLPTSTSLPARGGRESFFIPRAPTVCFARSFARAPVLSHSCATPRRAGSQRLAWFTPLTGTSPISDMCLSRVRRMPALS